uniref:T9SS type A sorting domain-containing protein n=1 Tax=candidate division WOR-3 bacterium TaxID=2052148 RepID=A0A7V3ZZ73_UNCW3
MLKRVLLISAVLGIVWAQKAKVEDLPPIPVETPMWIGGESKAPAPVLDTNWIYQGSTSNLTRQVGIGTHFKGLNDDTIRVVSVQSGGDRYLIIATDTTTAGFGTRVFRIETPYTFPSGATEHAVCIGDVDGDEYTDILTADNAPVGGYIWLRWFEWDPGVNNWVIRDSIGVGSSDYINNITIGDADNDGVARDILFNLGNNTNSAFMVAKWNGTSFDTTRVTFGRTQRYRAVAIGDLIPELPGNEVYTGGASDFAMAYFDGTGWQTYVLSTGLTGVNNIAIADINPMTPGPEICIVHGSTSYQLSVWYYTGTTFSGTAYALYATWGTGGYNDIEVGDFLTEIPGPEVVLTNTGTTITHYSLWFAYSPTGRAVAGFLPKIAAAADYGVKIADINRWRPGNEFVMTCGGHIVEIEQRLLSNDLSLMEGTRTLPLLKQGVYDTIRTVVVNSGTNPVTGVTFNYYFQNWVGTGSYTVPVIINPGEYAIIDVPVQMPGQLGIDTLFLSLADDDNVNNNALKFYIEVWDDSTVAASSFTDVTFPPIGWSSVILSGSYNWQRFTSGTYPTCSPLDGPAMAGYLSYYATAGSGARLIAPVDIGPTAKKVILNFYMIHDNGYASSYDSVYVEYSLDGENYFTLAGFQRYDVDATTPTWTPHQVEIGDFAGGTTLYVALRAKSGYGNNMYIDSVKVFVTQPTAPASDAEILSISIPKPVIQGEGSPVSVVFKNSGIDPIVQINLFYTLGGPDTVWEVWTGYLPGGVAEPYTFTTLLVPPDTGEFTVYAGVRLPGDANPDNDTISTTIHAWPYAQELPYAENFDEEWENSTNPPFGGWKIIDGGDEAVPAVNTNDWHRYEVTNPARTVARVHYSPIENQDDWLISPRLKIMGYGTYTLNYWHFYNDFSTSTLDSGRVLISFDDGGTWIELTRYSNADDSGYRAIDISSYVNNAYANGEEYFRIAFHYGARDEFYWYVDDFSVTYQPDVTPPTVEMIRAPQNTYNTGPDTVVLAVGDISPFYVYAFVVANDQIVAEFENNFAPGVDTIEVEIPGASAGTVYDGYIYVEDANGNSWMTQGVWWKLYAFSPGTPALTPISEPQKGVRLSWARPRESLAYDGGPAYYFTGIVAGDIISVRFTPQYVPARVDSVVALFYGTPAPMRLKIYDDSSGVPGNVLFDTLITVPVYPNYLRLDLAHKNIVVNGQYHIGFEWTVNDQPYPVSDAGANTIRSLYYEAASDQWYWAGYDWIIRSAVTYYPQGKAYAGNITSTKLSKDHHLKMVELPQIANKEDSGESVKYIEKYTILRSTTSGGPYDSVGVSTGTTYDDFTLETENTYYYVLRMDYLSPDTMTYGGEVSITTDFVGPEFSAFAYDSGGVGNIWVSVAITDPSGVYHDTLYYSVNGADFAFAMHDSVVGSTYFYTIPGLTVGDNVDLYFVAMDNSPWYNLTRYPETGYISFLVTSITDQKPTVYAFSIKGSNVAAKAMEFAYALPERSDVEISVYSVTGQKVATLVKGTKDAGYYTARWNGTDDRGSKVGSGVYIVKMTTPKKNFSTRIILTK